MTETNSQPFLPFTRPSIDEAAIADVAAVLRSGWLTSNGPKVLAFESILSGYFSGRPVRTFNSGTCTMEIALRIAGIGPGDEVITTPNSWVATANVIIEVGATPVFADIDPRSHNIDMAQMEAAITPRTRAIIPVHMCGLPCDMDKLYELAAKHSLRVVEDAAQAIGSTWKGNRIGTFGDMVSFSFQVNKNIMTGEGGCLVVNDAEEAALAERYRLQGVSRHGLDGIDVDVLGGKYNMTEIAAAIGLAQMRHLESFNAKRLALAKHYFDCFGREFETQYGAELAHVSSGPAGSDYARRIHATHAGSKHRRGLSLRGHPLIHPVPQARFQGRDVSGGRTGLPPDSHVAALSLDGSSRRRTSSRCSKVDT